MHGIAVRRLIANQKQQEQAAGEKAWMAGARMQRAE